MKITVNLEDTKPLKHSKRYNVRVFHSSTLDEIHEFDTLQAARDYAAKQKDFCLISMVIMELDNVDIKEKETEIDNIRYKIMRWCDGCPHDDYEESCGPRWQVCEDKKKELINRAKKLREEIDKEKSKEIE